MRSFGSILVCLVAFACSACTVVRVDGGNLRRYGGLLRLEPSDGATIVTVSSRNYGVVANGNSFLLGYGKSRAIVVPNASRCSAVIIIEKGSDEQLSRWEEFFSKYPNMCVEGEKK